MMENLEKIKAKHEAINMIMDIMAETGDARMVFAKEDRDFSEKTYKILINKEITDEQFIKLTSLLKQFSVMIDDCLKEEN